MYLVKLRPSGEKIIGDRLFIWEGGGTGAEKVWNKDGRKEGQEMCSRIMQAYEEG